MKIVVFGLVFLIFLSGCISLENTQENKSLETIQESKLESCTLHSECKQKVGGSGGGVAATQWDIYCDVGNCRRPTNFGEWETACKETSDVYRDECFDITTSIATNLAGYKTSFEICNRNYDTQYNLLLLRIEDKAESCRLRVCGFNTGNPSSSPGEESCVAEAISSTCYDGIKNGRESDVDCGLYECEPCDNGKVCRTNDACKSGVCNSNGTNYRFRCVSVCPDGPIKDNAPCGCGSDKREPQGYERTSVENWENKYGNGKTLFCCNGIVTQLFPDENCT